MHNRPNTGYFGSVGRFDGSRYLGIGVINPRADLIDQLLARVLEASESEAIHFDPLDEKCPIAFKVPSACPVFAMNLLAPDLVAEFHTPLDKAQPPRLSGTRPEANTGL